MKLSLSVSFYFHLFLGWDICCYSKVVFVWCDKRRGRDRHSKTLTFDRIVESFERYHIKGCVSSKKCWCFSFIQAAERETVFIGSSGKFIHLSIFIEVMFLFLSCLIACEQHTSPGNLVYRILTKYFIYFIIEVIYKN